MSTASYKMEYRNEVIQVSFAKGLSVTPDLILEAIIHEIAEYDNAHQNSLWDFRGCLPSEDFGYDAIERIIHYLNQQPEVQWNPRVAIVVDPGVQYGLSRMYQSLVDKFPTEIGIFYDHKTALTWAAEKKSAAAQKDRVERPL